MKSVHVSVVVRESGEITLPAHLNLPPGEYDAVLVIEERISALQSIQFDFPVIDVGPWPENLSLRREGL